MGGVTVWDSAWGETSHGPVRRAECLNWTFYGKVSEGQILHDEIM